MMLRAHSIAHVQVCYTSGSAEAASLSSSIPDFNHMELKVGAKGARGNSPSATLSAEVQSSAYEEGASVKLEAQNVEVKICRQLCEAGRVSDAVHVVDLLVQRGCHVPYNLLNLVLVGCIKHKDLVSGECIHSSIVKSGYEGDALLGTHLIRMYASLGRLEDAMRVFDNVFKPNAQNWATIIFANARHGVAGAAEAIRLYQQMRETTSIKPDNRIYSAVLKACASAGDLATGKQVHAHIVATPGMPDAFVQAGLVHMYAKCASLKDARSVFDQISQRTVVTWNVMIGGYAQQGMGQEALNLYSEMQRERLIPPDSITYLCLLQACASVGVGALHQGMHLHTEIKHRGLHGDVVLGGNLINMYAKCGSLDDARRVFDGLPGRNVVTWTTMIAGYAQKGMGREALQLYDTMQKEGCISPNAITYTCLLQACASCGVRHLQEGRQLHEHIKKRGLEEDLALGGSLVNMYAKCGSLEDARQLFDKLPVRNIAAWNALIAGYVQQGMGHEALRLYRGMEEEGVCPSDHVTFVCVLQACASVGVGALHLGKHLHALIKEQGLETDKVVGGSLVNMYAKCGSIGEARQSFDTLAERTVVAWTTMLAGYAQEGMGQEALSLYSRMQQECPIPPDSVTYACLLHACSSVGVEALSLGQQLHKQIKERGYQEEVALGSSLVNMYAKCGSLMYARHLFDRLPEKNVIAWTAIIGAYAQQGMGHEALGLYSCMQHEGLIPPNPVTYVCLLQACASVGVQALYVGQELHAQIQEQGLQVDLVLGGSFVNMYAKCGSLQAARAMFNTLEERNVVAWNAMITGYVHQGFCKEALGLYRSMQLDDTVCPDSVTYGCLLQACASIGVPALYDGKQLHAQIIERRLQEDVVLSGSLLNMYLKCGSFGDARQLFDRLPVKNAAAWTAMIGGYVQKGMGEEALNLYNIVVQQGHSPVDFATLSYLLQACASVGVGALHRGKQVHEQIQACGLHADAVLGGSLVNMYAKCGSLEDARRIFHRMAERTVVTWNAMLAGYVQQQMGEEALDLYSSMQQEGLAPDSVTYLCLLQACALAAALRQGKQLHVEIEARRMHCDVVLSGALVDMYAKCGSMSDSQRVFDSLPQRSVQAWGALIGGYARQGDCELVLNLFDRMTQEGVKPDGITLLSVLTVCSHTGQVDTGRKFFQAMADFGITATVAHWTCMMDLLGRAGHLAEALEMAKNMPVRPSSAVWLTLLSACRMWNDVVIGRQAFEFAVRLDRRDAAAYVLMSSIYANAEMWEEAMEIHARREECEAWKKPGQSWWIDMRGVVHMFSVGDAPSKTFSDATNSLSQN